MKTLKEVLKDLKLMVGNEFDENEVIVAFGDFEENGETDVFVSKIYGNKSNFEGHGMCQLYKAYINSENSNVTIFNIYVDSNNIVVYVH
jgi:hypothetical protein